jgi:Ca2+-binding RTX toxin-like protein
VIPIGVLLAMLLTGGVALAAGVTCSTVKNVLTGGTGQWCKGTDGPDTIIGAPTTGDRLEGFAGKDKLYGLGVIDALYGGAGEDEIHGDVAPDTRDAGVANWDALFGGTGADKLYAEDPDPATCAEAAACVDVLQAGQDDKRDDLYGGAGEDVYVVDRAAYNNGVDVIHDDQVLGDGVPLPSDDKPNVLHDAALEPGGHHLYFYR